MLVQQPSRGRRQLGLVWYFAEIRFDEEDDDVFLDNAGDGSDDCRMSELI